MVVGVVVVVVLEKRVGVILRLVASGKIGEIGRSCSN